MMNCKNFEMNEKRYTKKEGTKTVWILESEKTEVITIEHYNNYESSVGFFRNLGGTETITRGYEWAGYGMTHLVSTSPDKQTKVERVFTPIK